MKINKKKKTSLRFSCTSLVTLATLTVLLGGSNILDNTNTVFADFVIPDGSDVDGNVSTVTETEPISVGIEYMAAGRYSSVPFRTKRLLKSGTTGERQIIYTVMTINGQTEKKKVSELITRPVQNDIYEVGNIETTYINNAEGISIPIQTEYDVDLITGTLMNPHIIQDSTISSDYHIIPYTTRYVPDASLNFEQKYTAQSGQNGSETVIWKHYGSGKSEIIDKKDYINPVDKIVRVGNKQVVATDEDNKHIVTTTLYDVDPNDGTLTNPKLDHKTETETDHVIIPAGNHYTADSNLRYEEQQTDKNKQDGSKDVTSITITDANGHVSTSKTESNVHDPVTGEIRVGNKKVEATDEGNKHIVTTTLYDVDPNDGTLTNPHFAGKTVTETKSEPIPYTGMHYVADDSLPYDTKVVDKDPQEGSKNVTYITITDADGYTNTTTTDGETTKEPVKGEGRVGNKQVEIDGNKTTTTIYNINPDTGSLDLTRPVMTKIQETKVESIPAETTYKVDSSLDFNKQKVEKSAVNGKKEVVYLTEIDSEGNRATNVQDEKTIVPVQNGIVGVGNIEAVANGDDSTTYKRYEVDSKTGKTVNPTVIATTGKVTKEVIKAVVNYVADADVDFDKTEVVITPQDGLKTTINMDIVKDGQIEKHPDKVETTDPINGETHVGNVEIIVNGDGSKTVKVYDVNPTTGKLENPKVIGTIGKVTTEPIKAVVKYVADPNVDFGQTKDIVKPKDGLKTITNMDIVKDGKLEHHDDKVDIVNSINGETHVGNKKTETDKDGKTTITVYNVDPKTGKLDIKTPNTVKTTQVKMQEIPATITYQADSNLDFNKQVIATPAVNGTMKVTYTTVETPDTKRGNKHSEVIKEAQNGLTKVGNKKTETDKDGKTTITVYNVDPKTGKLINPKVISKTIVEPEFISDVPVAESDIKIGDQVDSKTAETTDTKSTNTESNVDKVNTDKQTKKTHVSLQTGVDNAGRLATAIASASALITAAYTAIRRRKD